MLYQLSYAPRLELVGLSGLEPLTSRLSGGRSNQLSYRPEQAIDLSSACHQLNGVEMGKRVALVAVRSSYASPPSALFLRRATSGV